ncbi:MAG: hypothetical protein PHV34_21290 [Verrucomicrobiae bacterium]|nr:hypothetical protein [Verrucomicrobiae bacterium]
MNEKNLSWKPFVTLFFIGISVCFAQTGTAPSISSNPAASGNPLKVVVEDSAVSLTASGGSVASVAAAANCPPWEHDPDSPAAYVWSYSGLSGSPQSGGSGGQLSLAASPPGMAEVTVKLRQQWRDQSQPRVYVVTYSPASVPVKVAIFKVQYRMKVCLGFDPSDINGRYLGTSLGSIVQGQETTFKGNSGSMWAGFPASPPYPAYAAAYCNGEGWYMIGEYRLIGGDPDYEYKITVESNGSLYAELGAGKDSTDTGYSQLSAQIHYWNAPSSTFIFIKNTSRPGQITKSLDSTFCRSARMKLPVGNWQRAFFFTSAAGLFLDLGSQANINGRVDLSFYGSLKVEK